MSFDWEGYFDLADWLFHNPATAASEEASLRSAVSRAYYAAFCSARNFARNQEGLQLKNDPRDHPRVALHFQNAADRDRRKVGVWLGRLREDRRQADYEDDVPGLPSLAQNAVADTRELLNILKLL